MLNFVAWTILSSDPVLSGFLIEYIISNECDVSRKNFMLGQGDNYKFVLDWGEEVMVTTVQLKNSKNANWEDR